MNKVIRHFRLDTVHPKIWLPKLESHVLTQHVHVNVELDPVQALDYIDAATRRRVLQATTSQEINEVLDDESVVWQSHARCLRHPLRVGGGCPISIGSDVDSHLNCQLHFLFQTRVTRVQYKQHSSAGELHSVFPFPILYLPAQDLAGVSCKDDSSMGSRRQDKGEGRKAALVYWRPWGGR